MGLILRRPQRCVLPVALLFLIAICEHHQGNHAAALEAYGQAVDQLKVGPPIDNETLAAWVKVAELLPINGKSS